MLRYSVGFRILRTEKFGTVSIITVLNSNIGIYVGGDGKLHFKNGSGADTALNFSSYDKGYRDGLNAWIS